MQKSNSIFGKLFGDTGCISKILAELLFKEGIQPITKVRKNKKKKLLHNQEKRLFRKSAIIETVNDKLKNICQIEHTRQGSVNGFLFNLLGAFVYSLFRKQSSINVEFESNDNQLYLAAA